MSEKKSFDVEQRPMGVDIDDGVLSDKVEHTGAVHLAEAAELYGDPQAAESYRYVARGLKARHIQFMGLGGSIGTALFLGIGRALAAAGPLSIFLGFTISGMAIFGMMQCLGEMTTWLPMPAALPSFASRYVDKSLGFAVGWNGWYSYTITICIEISAAAVIIGYWNTTINVAVWISIIIVLLVFLNLFAVSIYGEAEFWFASLKIITIVGLLILALVLDLGGGPNHDRIGFRYWKNPGAMNTFVAGGSEGRFLGFFFSLVMGALSYGGVESVIIAAGEAENPRRNLPKAIRRVFWRLLLFYVLGSLAVGVLVPYNDPDLLTALATGAPGAASSPWVIAIKRAGIPALPSIINVVILSSATSAANACLYNGSRYLMAMAQLGLAPRFFLRCSKRGIPYYGVGFTALLTGLTYLSCSAGPVKVFIWLGNISALVSMFSWLTICITYVRFYAALKKQGVNRDDLPFKSPFQPYLAWATMVFLAVLMLFNGFYAFTPWDTDTFISTYITVPVFFGLFIFWKVFKKTKFVDPAEADLWTGKASIDAEVWQEPVAKNFLQKASS
ncbi:AAT family amino acid transporter [Capronia epimyces CBS 606.96]|uniref:AAT family amino acid transporter n=1 Tax=Capronia epimyces CBS 606.96 TaxID=1182542 RepID=W9XBJ6_9EURO|nr:AAT family amino acid transporter [Capronia epimyces CBS 606.96]EXJ77827.1 AAT family amino acid transporter [Capronia epimyces CBS 606.96]